jgi:hypothetical protein
MYRKVSASKIVFDVIFKEIMGVNIKDWRRVEKLVRWMFITRCEDSGVELEVVAEKDIDVLRFFVEWEVEKKGRDMQINIGGKGFIFRKCKVVNIEVKDFRTYYDGEALSLTVGMTHSGIAMRMKQ